MLTTLKGLKETITKNTESIQAFNSGVGQRLDKQDEILSLLLKQEERASAQPQQPSYQAPNTLSVPFNDKLSDSRTFETPVDEKFSAFDDDYGKEKFETMEQMETDPIPSRQQTETNEI